MDAFGYVSCTSACTASMSFRMSVTVTTSLGL